LLLAIACVMVVVGLLFTGEQWGVAMVFAGAGAAALCLIGVLLSQPAIAFVGSLICVCGGMVAASLAEPDASWASPALTAGLLGLVGLGLLGAYRMLSGSAGARGGKNGVTGVLSEIRDIGMLSDTAKRILFRDREMELLRQTIEEDIERGDFNAGLVLCRDMERLFGYTEEAEQLRQRVLLSRNSQLAAKIHQEVAVVAGMLAQGRLDEAEEAGQRLHRMYPDSPALHGLQSRLHGARQQMKRDLKSEFLSAAQRGDTQVAMAKLRQLDHHLSPDEVADVHAAAEGIIGQHREALSVQFKLAVSDHRWTEAVEAGEQIIADFPNDRMAVEVREVLERLRERANVVGSEETV
jgi:hypothetical protein